MRLLQRLKTFSDRLFTRHLFATNTALGLTFMAAGDSVQQYIERRFYPDNKFDTNRTKNMVTVGIGFGVLGHLWYKFLDTRFPGKATLTVFKKLLAEGVIGPPLCLCFFVGMGLLQEKSVRKSYENFKENFLMICLADYGIYMPLQAINFFFLPPRYRFGYVAVLCFAYDIFLSYVIHKEDNIESTKAKENISIVSLKDSVQISGSKDA